ncbi:MAG: SDR family oxidoreductase [Thermoplasmata archaeon]|nr:SDR family oxidoreductase [Thermoplasmata archaeon]
MRALVTGASRGIGRETAKLLAAEGNELALHHFRHREEAEQLAVELASGAGSAFTLSADMGSPSSIDRMASELAARWDRLDVLVQNAGSYPRGSIFELTDEQVDSTLATNLLGPIRLVRRLLPLLKGARAGRIILVSSVLAFTGSVHGAPYATAKAGLLGFARSLARELAPRITVNVVAPGATDTAILAADTPELRKRREAQIPLGRVASPKEVAEAIAFLASPRAGYITGSTLHVNGGIYFG